jgi:hypothetical protein
LAVIGPWLIPAACFVYTDGQGRQRVKRFLRDAVKEAAQAGISHICGGKSQGFVYDISSVPARIKRFERPFVEAELAAQKPDFILEDEL